MMMKFIEILHWPLKIVFIYQQQKRLCLLIFFSMDIARFSVLAISLIVSVKFSLSN